MTRNNPNAKICKCGHHVSMHRYNSRMIPAECSGTVSVEKGYMSPKDRPCDCLRFASKMRAKNSIRA